MKRKRKRTLSALLAVMLLFLTVLPGCDLDYMPFKVDKAYEDPVTFRVLVDQPFYDRTRVYLQDFAREFETSHTNVTIDFITELKKDQAPDIYLLSTGIATTTFDSQAPLISDVERAMRDGLFLDLSEYYNADAELTAGLNDTIMDAGVINDFRFTLPLRFDYPVVTVNPDALRGAGLNTDIFNGGINMLLNELYQLDDTQVAADLAADLGYMPHYDFFTCFPDFTDYSQHEVLLTYTDLLDFMDCYFPYYELRSEGTFSDGTPTLTNYLFNQATWLQQGNSISISSLEAAIMNAAFAKAEGVDIQMYPLTGTDGRLVAEVARFGAVGVSCKRPDLAYEFLRHFLTKECQWETDLLTHNLELGIPGFEGYSVRTTGSVSTCYQNAFGRAAALMNYDANDPADTPLNRLAAVVITEEDVPILQREIDIARYPLPEMEFEFGQTFIYALQNPGADDAKPEVIADNILMQLETYIRTE